MHLQCIVGPAITLYRFASDIVETHCYMLIPKGRHCTDLQAGNVAVGQN